MTGRTTRGRVVRGVLLAIFGLYFMFPLYAMADFSTRNLIEGGRTLQPWKNLGPERAALLRDHHLPAAGALHGGADASVLVPTMIWTRLRAPWAKGAVDFLCLLPLTIPALVIVVGLRESTCG